MFWRVEKLEYYVFPGDSGDLRIFMPKFIGEATSKSETQGLTKKVSIEDLFR
jgi:hypothetical protein